MHVNVALEGRRRSSSALHMGAGVGSRGIGGHLNRVAAAPAQAVALHGPTAARPCGRHFRARPPGVLSHRQEAGLAQCLRQARAQAPALSALAGCTGGQVVIDSRLRSHNILH